MKSILDDQFRACFRRLPLRIQDKARKNYRLWKINSAHPSLHFKQVHESPDVFSIRIGPGWRALGVLENKVLQWFWIGSHAEYDRLLKRF